MQTNILTLNKIKTQTVQVSEPIIKEALLDFLFTSTQHNKLEWDVKFLCHYFKESKNYFIASFKDKSEQTALLPQVLKVHYKKHQAQKYDLFVAQDFFALYHDAKLVYFKAILQEVNEDEIIHFLQQSLKIRVHQCYEISETTLQSYIQLYEEEKLQQAEEYHTFKSIKQTLSFLIFSLFTATVLTVSILSFQATQQNNKNRNVIFEAIEHKALKTQSLVEVLERINAYKLQLLHLKIGDKQAHVKLRHQSKTMLLDFLKAYSLKLKSLSYKKEEEAYELVASFIF